MGFSSAIRLPPRRGSLSPCGGGLGGGSRYEARVSDCATLPAPARGRENASRDVSSDRRAEIDFAHLRAIHHLARIALRDHAPEIQHHEPRDDRQQRMDDMFDPDDRRPRSMDLADRRDQFLAFALGQAAGDFVEQQQARLRRRARAPFRGACGRAATGSRRGGWPSTAGRSPRESRRRIRRLPLRACRARNRRRRADFQTR